MKNVFSSNSELIHVWANNPERSARAGNMSCGGGVLWSYNTAIAQHVTNDNGEKAVILNATSYSNSTSKQQGKTFYAVNHLKRIYIRHIGYSVQSLKPSSFTVTALIESYELHAAELLKKAERARTKKQDYEVEAFQHLTEIKTYLEFFGIPYEMPANLDALKQAAIDRENEQKRIAAEMKARRIADQAEKLQLWRNGENVHSYLDAVALRIKGDVIETTRGANIPLDHAVKIWPLLKRLHTIGGTYTRGDKSIHLGHYTLDSFDGNELRVGCHVIPFTEILNIANQLGL